MIISCEHVLPVEQGYNSQIGIQYDFEIDESVILSLIIIIKTVSLKKLATNLFPFFGQILYVIPQYKSVRYEKQFCLYFLKMRL